jgi:hypothetical protein
MRVVTVLLLVVCVSSIGFAQTSFQPLKRSEDVLGQYMLQLSLGYVPSGQDGFDVDDSGQPYSYTRFSQQRHVGVSGTLVLAGGWKLGLDLANVSTTTEELRKYFDQEAEVGFTRNDSSYSVSYEYRLDEKNIWDPRISLSLGYPWRGGIEVSASLIRDPTVLAGSVSMLSQAEEPRNWLLFSLGAGFVANSLISLSASASVMIPTHRVGLPITTVSLRATYSLDSQNKREAAVHTTLNIQGEVPQLMIEAKMSWNGP